MRTAADILHEHGLRTSSTAPGRYYVTCPKCSAARKTAAHKHAKVLGITIDDEGVHFGCSHCGWKDGGYYNGKASNGRGRDDFAAVHEYGDENGTVIGRKARNWPGKEPKCWWIGGTNGRRMPLYKLAELIEALAAEHTIAIPEGEKDVDNLRAIGVPATCNPDGAAEPGQRPKWRQEYSERLRDADIVIIPDHDPQGYAHADAIACMSTGIAKRIRILKLAEHWAQCPEGGDVSDWLKAGHTREDLDALIAQAQPWTPSECDNGGDKNAEHDPTKATIRISKGEIARIVDEAEAALVTVSDVAPIMVRAGKLVQPIVDLLPAAHGRVTQITLLKPLTASNIVYLLNKFAATFERFDGRSKEWLEVDPPNAVAVQLLEKGQWPFPKVAGVITAPTLRPDGTILDQPGHDAATLLWYAPDRRLTLPPRIENPTREQAEQALALLESLLVNFPFESEVDQSVALTGILTPVLRGAFDVAPMDVFRAPDAGSGKSFLADLISTIARGQPCPVISNSRSVEEMEKRLGALVLEGVQIISLDNCSNNIGGDLLCQITERPLIRIRILGKSEVPECEWRGTLLGTGNNITLFGDMTRRGLISNLDPKTERPELRTFAFDPIERVLEDRGAYIAACLTIARGYIAAGAPKVCDPLGSYGGWSKMVRSPLVWLGKADPVRSMDRAREEDPARIAVNTLIDIWRMHLQPNVSYTAADLTARANERMPRNCKSYCCNRRVRRAATSTSIAWGIGSLASGDAFMTGTASSV